MADINDILGINLPPEQPQTKRKIIEDLLTNLVFSIGQGYSAQAGQRGPAARSAGIGAALQGPMVLQQIRQKQAEDAQDRQIKIAQLRQAALKGDQEAALRLREALSGSIAPTESVTTTGLPIPVTMDTEMPLPPVQYPLGGGKTRSMPIASAQDAIRASGMAEEQKQAILAKYRPAPEKRLFNTPGGTLDPDNPQGGFVQGTTPTAEAPVLSPDVVTVDGKGPVPVFRDKQGNYFDATTKRPITGRIGVYEKPDRAPDQSARADRSFTAQTKEIDDEAAPVRDGIQRVGRLISTLDAGSPVADAVTAPELMVVMAGGVGSGVRITQGEINTIFGAQSKIEQAKAALKQFSTDPDKANRILEPMRAQMRQLVDAVNDKLQKKQAIITTARQALIDTDDVKKQRQIVADAKAAMVRVDAGRVKMVGTSGQEFWVDADKVEAAKKVGGRIVPPPKL